MTDQATDNGNDVTLNGDTPLTATPVNDETNTPVDDTTPENQDVSTDKSAEDSKADKSQDKPEGAPEKYEDFTLPENVSVNEGLMSEFQDLAKELNLSQEQAQKLIDLQSRDLAKAAEAAQERWDVLKTEWADSAKSDTEFGGQNFDANVGLAKQALDQFGTPELKEALEVTGTGSHPEIIRFFYRVGKALKEADMLTGSAPVRKKSAAELIYTTMDK